MELDKIIDITLELVGEEASQVVEFLHSHPGASEFEINENLGFPVSQVRSVLYELKAKNLIDYDRRKDKEKGWYLYYWRVVEENFDRVYVNEKKKSLEMFKERLQKEEETTFYLCPNYCLRAPFEQALEKNFTCPVCGSLMNEENKTRKVEMLRRNIAEHEAILHSSN
ncbi:MAG: hypothetical protein ACMXYB_03640 [Candidatus Woesearchaeota archaeon]